MRMICKILLAFIILLTLLVTLITLFIYGFNLAVSTLCNISNEFSLTEEFSPFFNTDDSQLVALANQCLGKKADGDLFKVINVDAFNGLQDMLKGIQNFNLELTNINNMGNTSSTLQTISSAINDVLSGNAHSHSTVSSQLASLNSMVKCANLEFAMILSSTAQVKSITDKGQLQAGACYNLTSAETIRASLEVSFTANRTAFSTLSSKVTSAHSNYQTTVTSLKSARVDFGNIYKQLEDSFGKMQQFQSDFKTTFDCKILQQLFYNLEYNMCGSFKKNLYILMVFLYIISYIMFFLNCCICCMTKRK